MCAISCILNSLYIDAQEKKRESFYKIVIIPKQM
jgi:hypothetical protein